MGSQESRRRIDRHLHALVEVVGARPPGSPANRRATAYVQEVLTRAGLRTAEASFRTRWWEPGPVELLVRGVPQPVLANPYSPPAQVTGVVRPLQGEHAHTGTRGVVLVGAELAPEPLMPRAFPFLTPTAHAELLDRLEALQPAAVVTVSDGPPVLEDPDLPFPSVTVSTDTAAHLAGEEAVLRIGGAVREAGGVTVSARSGPAGRRTVVSAHVDSKVTTPGAFDNAGSVAAVLAWVEAGLPPDLPLEVVFFNGEDHFDACGEQAWLAATDLSEVLANVNLDGAGVRGRTTSAALLAGSASLQEALAVWLRQQGWESAAPWYESDHAIFAMQGIPAVAVTSAGVHDLLRDIAHTPRDTLGMVDTAVLADVASSLTDLAELVSAG